VKADTSYKKLLRLVNTYMSDNSGYVSTVYTNYATFLNEQGRQDEALEALKKAYDVQIEGGNPSDNNMLIIYGNFGVVNQEQGNHKKALENFEKAYEIGLRMVGEYHEFMAMIHTYNGISLAHLGLTQRAKNEIQRGYEMRIRLGGEQNWSLSASEYALAELSVLESNFDEAASHLLKSISYLRSIYDANHQLVLKSTDRLLEVYIKAGKNDLAQTYADNFLVDLKNADGSIQSQLDRYEFIKSYLVLK
jgi:tetratricopeptide (TPR) repeat protein